MSQRSTPCMLFLIFLASKYLHYCSYDAVERPAQGSSVAPPESWTKEEVLRWLTRLASSIREGSEVKPDVDLFQQGFDR
jgi:hypothetical protein